MANSARIILPSGKKHKLGFLSPCRNGFVLGTVEVEEADTSQSMNGRKSLIIFQSNMKSC